MIYDMIIQGGNVVFPIGVRKSDIGIKEEKIVCISESMDSDEANIRIDATGKYVMPGMVDTHVHIDEPGHTEREGYETGSKALAAGGTTCYLEMPLNTLPSTTNKKALELKISTAKNKNYVDYGFYGGLVPDNFDVLDELIDGGVIAFKCFLSTFKPNSVGDFESIDDYTLYKGMKYLAAHNQMLCIHAENAAITDKLSEEMIKANKISAMDFVESRPIIAEVEAVQRVILFSKATGCRVHIVHVSSADAVEVILKAQLNGVQITLESCPHYFAITAEQFEEIGLSAKCAPPVRKEKDQKRLWQAYLDGKIDHLTSDHSPSTPELKKGNVFEALNGIMGAQNNIDIMFDLAVKQRNMPVHKFVNTIAYNPAKRFNLHTKGEIAVSKDADITILDPNQSYILKEEDLYNKNKLSPYIGRKINCRITTTIVRGHKVYDFKEGIVGNPVGKLLKQNKKKALTLF